MPSPNDKQLTLAYAAGASLAAVTLVYVFGPTWFIDSSNSSSRQRKKGVVGLVNTANDCFVCTFLSGAECWVGVTLLMFGTDKFHFAGTGRTGRVEGVSRSTD